MRPSSIRIVVVLPEPLGPRKPYTEPVGTARLTPSTVSWPPRNRLDSPVLLIATAGQPDAAAGGRDLVGSRSPAGGGSSRPKPISSRGPAPCPATLIAGGFPAQACRAVSWAASAYSVPGVTAPASTV